MGVFFCLGNYNFKVAMVKIHIRDDSIQLAPSPPEVLSSKLHGKTASTFFYKKIDAGALSFCS